MTTRDVTEDHSHETLYIQPVPEVVPENPESRVQPVIADRHTLSRPITDSMVENTIVVSSYITGNQPKHSDTFNVSEVECRGEFSYWLGLHQQWDTDKTIINVEQDMEFSDDLVAELLDCEHPLCAFPYQVYPTQLGRYIYCATTTPPTTDGSVADPRWIEGPDDEWAIWSSVGFAKIAPAARVKPLDKLFWQWLEHSINRVVTSYAGLQWHIHWPEIRHHHDYNKIPDHLW